VNDITLTGYDLLCIWAAGQVLLSVLALLTKRSWAPREVLGLAMMLAGWPVVALVLLVQSIIASGDHP
jgi:hypothetical protein